MWYQIIDDVEYPDRWHLGTVVPASGDEWAFWSFFNPLTVIEQLNWGVDIRYSGKLLNFTFSGFDVPIVDNYTKGILTSVCFDDFELLPVSIKDKEGQFYILHLLNEVDCVDEKKSEFIKWREEDNRPDKTGEYRMITRLQVDPSKIPKRMNIFRLKGWNIAIVCSGRVRQSLSKTTGIKFESVT